jgi:hypothetical protein
VHANHPEQHLFRTREPRTAPVDIRPQDIQPDDRIDDFPDDVCWTVDPPAGGWNPTARYRVEIDGSSPGAARLDTGYTAAYDANGRSTSHSYSYYASAAAAQEIPMARIRSRDGQASGGLLEYGH